MILAGFREGLRGRIDPDTGEVFTEDTIRVTTARGGRWYTEADAIDVVLLGLQKRSEFLVNQLRIDRSGSGWLRNYHGPLWGEGFLPAFGGAGVARASGVPGTTWQGSTLVPDLTFARYAIDAAGRRFQVITTGTAGADGTVLLGMLAIDGGRESNIAIGTELTWVNPPPGSAATATTVERRFSGGLDAETDADFGRRLASRVRRKPASGNWAHLRAYARQASVACEDAFVYCSAFHAGSVLVAVTRKRGATKGPSARIADVGLLGAVTSAIVPPGSPLVPGRFHAVVVPCVAQASNAIIRLAQPYGSVTGWADFEPFPRQTSSAASISTVTSQTNFRISTGSAGQLPGGVAGPLGGLHLMVWDVATSAFEELDVVTVQDLGSGQYQVILAEAPDKTLAVGDWVSPAMARATTIADATTAYFDALGPGEVLNLATDERGSRAFRQPPPNEEYPQRAGQGLVSYLAEALGGTATDETLASLTVTSPSVPSDPVLGPRLLVVGKVSVYPLS